MSDREVKYTITADATVAVNASKQTAEAFKQVNSTTKDITAVAEKATEATNKWTVSKNQLKAAVKGLAVEVPILGRAWQMVSNPITFSVAAITVAVSALREKLKAAATDFQAAGWGTERVNAAAEAYKGLAAVISQMKVDSRELNQNLAQIETHSSNLRKLGADNPLASKQEQEERGKAQSSQIYSLRAKAQELRRQAGVVKVPTEMQDKNTLAGLEPDAARAEGEISKLNEEIAFLEKYMDPETSLLWRTTVGATRYDLKYGALVGPADALSAVKYEREGWQGMVNTRDKYKTRMGSNAAARAYRSTAFGKADDMDAQAAQLEEQRRREQFNSNVNYGMAMSQYGVPVAVTAGGAGASITPDAAAEIAQMRQQAAAITAAFNQMVALWGQTQRDISAVAARASNQK